MITQKTLYLTLILSLMILKGSCVTFDTNIQCQKCDIPCNNVNCYRLNAPGYNQQVCGNQTCTIGSNYTVRIDQCNFDWNGVDCPTGLCYFPYIKKGCADKVMKITSCDNPFAFQFSCKNCTKYANCNKCTFSVNAPGQLQQNCLGTSCNGVQTVSAQINRCNLDKDENGNSCTCCYTITNNITTLNGVCSTRLDAVSSALFSVFARNKTLSPAILAQTCIMASILMLLLFFASFM